MEIRIANDHDIERILEIIQQAKAYLKSQDIDQWQNGYPNKESIQEDIRLGHSYVLCQENYVVATSAIIFEADPNYDYIENGSWLTQGPYGVIHRIACDNAYKGQGIASLFFEYAKMQASIRGFQSLRVDTHPQNKSMQHLIAKNGFQYCGIVYMADGGLRFAYEDVLKRENQYGF